MESAALTFREKVCEEVKKIPRGRFVDNMHVDLSKYLWKEKILILT